MPSRYTNIFFFLYGEKRRDSALYATFNNVYFIVMSYVKLSYSVGLTMYTTVHSSFIILSPFPGKVCEARWHTLPHFLELTLKESSYSRQDGKRPITQITIVNLILPCATGVQHFVLPDI